ncbi:HD domain-containing phosphohydrolase [Vibrio splendidus]|uniref:HD domain-containing phosphohydrolase n=1 Tax=Vibrio splendidus TaxID=29497 RepID=UPI002469C06F|nr:HD domain-containing phosphohydrolase [Vibrio splendidus]MDH5886359.1 response regulator [Vibrio splendidus]
MNKKEFNLLIVDDQPLNLELLSGILFDTYNIKVATNGDLALKLAELTPKPDLIILDVVMPNLDGFEVCLRLKNNPLTASIPVIFLTARNEVENETKGFELGAVDYIVKPFSASIVKSRVATHLALHNQTKLLEKEVLVRTKEIRQNQSEIIACLSRAAEFKDNETGMHVVRMSHYSRILAEALGVEDKWSQLLFEASPMHDIGKIGIADRVLRKNGSLDPDEWEQMKKHVIYGVKILGDHSSELLDMAHQIIEYHHEKWDGSGYPKGVKGTDIPLAARIVMIADVFDALTSERPYKQAWSTDRAFEYLYENSGSHFDERLVTVFLLQKDKILDVKESFSD